MKFHQIWTISHFLHQITRLSPISPGLVKNHQEWQPWFPRLDSLIRTRGVRWCCDLTPINPRYLMTHPQSIVFAEALNPLVHSSAFRSVITTYLMTHPHFTVSTEALNPVVNSFVFKNVITIYHTALLWNQCVERLSLTE